MITSKCNGGQESQLLSIIKVKIAFPVLKREQILGNISIVCHLERLQTQFNYTVKLPLPISFHFCLLNSLHGHNVFSVFQIHINLRAVDLMLESRPRSIRTTETNVAGDKANSYHFVRMMCGSQGQSLMPVGDPVSISMLGVS